MALGTHTTPLSAFGMYVNMYSFVVLLLYTFSLSALRTICLLKPKPDEVLLEYQLQTGDRETEVN